MKILKHIQVVLLMLLLAGCSDEKKTADPFSHVNAKKIQPHNIEYVLNYPAFVQGLVDYKVIPRISGAIFKKYYTEGTFVTKGTPLYQIDPRPYEWELMRYEGQLIKDKAARDNYRIIYERYQNLYKIKAVSKQELELKRIDYYAAIGNVQSIEADIGRTKLSLKYCLVRSPADGYIAERHVTVGTMVTAWETVLNIINSVNNMYLLFSMPENQRLDIEEGVANNSVEIPQNATFPVDIRLATGKVMKNVGYVEFTDTRIALINGTWNMRAYVNNCPNKIKLLAGQYVTVFIRNIIYTNMIGLPQSAVMLDDKGHYVYVIENHKAVRRYVTTGKMYGKGMWMIKEGLKPNETVITHGNIRIDDGQAVTIDKTEVA